MLMLLLAGCVVLVMVSEGDIRTRSSKSRTCVRASTFSVATHTDDDTSWRFSRRFSAVTTTVSSVRIASVLLEPAADASAEGPVQAVASAGRPKKIQRETLLRFGRAKSLPPEQG